MGCEEKHRLLDHFRAAAGNYATTVNDLDVTRSRTSKQEYRRLLLVTDKALETSEKARLAFFQHTREHGC
jgi:hypothetical protein